MGKVGGGTLNSRLIHWSTSACPCNTKTHEGGAHEVLCQGQLGVYAPAGSAYIVDIHSRNLIRDLGFWAEIARFGRYEPLMRTDLVYK